MPRNAAFASLPKFHRGAFWLFATVAVASALLADQPAGDALRHGPGFTRDLALWQPLTANFVFPNGALGGLIGTAAAQWLIAGNLESFWGTRRYLVFALACGTAGYLVAALVGFAVPEVAAQTLGGSSPIDLAAIVAYGIVFARRRFNLLGALPLTARSLMIAVVVISIAAPLARGAPWPELIPTVVAMIVAALWVTQPWRRGGNSGKLRKPPKKSRPRHLRVVRSDDRVLH